MVQLIDPQSHVRKRRQDRPITKVNRRLCVRGIEQPRHLLWWDGCPSELTLRRWRRFGLSGAKLIWGGEAAAVQHDGRANPNQTLATTDNRDGLAALLAELQSGHLETCGTFDGFFAGLQLTHSGRFCKPHVAQAVVREGWVDFVGLGRMVLSYPKLPHDVLTTGQMSAAPLAIAQQLLDTEFSLDATRLMSITKNCQSGRR